VNKEASHYVRLFGGNKIGNLTFWLPFVLQSYGWMWHFPWETQWSAPLGLPNFVCDAEWCKICSSNWFVGNTRLQNATARPRIQNKGLFHSLNVY